MKNSSPVSAPRISVSVTPSAPSLTLSADAAAPSAAILAIGDELLSGRTKDKNIVWLAEALTAHGIDLREARIIPDDAAEIGAALNALRKRYDYVFTSGGIGPTHDDITAEAVASAFGRPCIFDPRAEAVLEQYYKQQNSAMTEGRRLMCRMPQGAELIENKVSGAPGFQVENCFIMAGVPQIFQAMAQAVLPHLRSGAPMQSLVIACPFGESSIAAQLGEIQRQCPQVSIGSYPHLTEKPGQKWQLELALRSRNAEALTQAAEMVKKMLADCAARS